PVRVFHTSCSNLYVVSRIIHTTITYIYPLSLHDALPIYTGSVRRSDQGASLDVLREWYRRARRVRGSVLLGFERRDRRLSPNGRDRKSTRLNSSHEWISYAVFCLKKKKTEAK